MLYNKQTIEKVKLIENFIWKKLNIRLLRSVYEESSMEFRLFFDTDDWHNLNFYNNEKDRNELLLIMTSLEGVSRDFSLLTKKDSLLFELLREEEVNKRKYDTYFNFTEGVSYFNIVTENQIRNIMWTIKTHGLWYIYNNRKYNIKKLEAIYNVDALEEPKKFGSSDIWHVGNNYIHTIKLELQEDGTKELSYIHILADDEDEPNESMFIRLSKKLVYKRI